MPNDSQSRMARRSTGNTTGNKKPQPKKKRSVGSVILKIFGGLIILGCIAFLSGLGLFWFYAKIHQNLLKVSWMLPLLQNSTLQMVTF